jgi:IS4 transposase
VADTGQVAQLYRDRWSVETLFQTVTENFNGEIQTLADPKAALFSLAMAFATYNIWFDGLLFYTLKGLGVLGASRNAPGSNCTELK